MSTEFEVGGHKYVFTQMDAMTQFHVICKFGPAMKAAALKGGTTMLETFAELTDSDREFVITKCLSRVKRQVENGGGWADIWDKRINSPAYQDINALHLMDISSKVMEESFEAFFPEPPLESDGLQAMGSDTSPQNFQTG
jgi:hypothetical protein